MRLTKQGVFVGVMVLAVLLVALPALAQGDGTLIFGDPLEATISDGEVHTYTFGSDGGEMVTLSMTTQDDLLDPVLELYDPAGALIAFNDDRGQGTLDAALFDIMLPAGGEYTVLARSYGNRGAGAYTLLAEREAAASLDTTGTISMGETANGELFVEGQVDRWLFDGTAGQTISITMIAAPGSQLDTLVELVGPDGATLTYNDDNAFDTNSLLSGYVLPADGTYTIIARSWGNSSTGSYTLGLQEGASEPAQPDGLPPLDPGGQPPVNAENPITIGQTVSGDLPSGMMDLWTLEAQGEIAISISMTAASNANLDTYLEVVGENDEIIASNDDFEGLNSFIRSATLPQAGTYIIRARSYANSSGGLYTLTVDEAVPLQVNTGNIEPGQTVTAQLDTGSTDEWTLVAREGDVYSIGLFGLEGMDTVLRVVGPDDAELLYDDDGGIGLNSMISGWTVPADGAYVILAGSFADSYGGPYTLTVEQGTGFVLPEGVLQGPLTLGEPQSGTFEDSGIQAWTVEIEAGSYIQPSYNGLFYATLIDEQGNEIGYLDGMSPVVVPSSGTYFILLEGDQGTDYTLTVSAAEPPPSNTGNVEPGQTISATLALSATDRWTLAAREGEHYSIAVYADASGFDTTLSIQDENGNELLFDDDGGIGVNSLAFDWVVPADGAYTLAVSSYGNYSEGPYTLTVQSGAEFVLPEGWTQGPLPVNGAAEGSFTAEQLVHIWTVEAGAGQQMVFDFDDEALYIEIMNSSGFTEGYATTGEAFPFSQTGVYYIAVYGSQPGDYSLKFRTAE